MSDQPFPSGSEVAITGSRGEDRGRVMCVDGYLRVALCSEYGNVTFGIDGKGRLYHEKFTVRPWDDAAEAALRQRTSDAKMREELLRQIDWRGIEATCSCEDGTARLQSELPTAALEAVVQLLQEIREQREKYDAAPKLGDEPRLPLSAEVAP